MNDKLKEYSALLDQAPCGIGLFSGTDTRQAIYLNKTYYQMIGYSKEEYEQLHGDAAYALVCAEDLPGLLRFVRHELDNASEWEYRIVNKAGQLVWMKLNISSVLVGNESYSFASFVDVTKEKELADRMALVTTNVDYSISILRLEGDQAYLEYANDAFYNLTGYSKEQYLSDTMGYARQAVDANVFETMRPLIQKAVETGRPQTMEYPLTRSDGSVSWLRRQFSVIKIPGALRLLSVTGDITERHHAEEMLKNIVSNIPAGIVVYHISAGTITIQEANPAVCKIMGIARARMLGSKDSSFMKYTHPDDLESVKETAAAFATPNTAIHYEYRHYNPQKEAYVWLSADGRSIARPDGSTQVYVSYVDISSQKTMESELALRDEALRIADKSLSAGTVINSLGLNKPLLYVSENFESFLGYTVAEFREMYSRQYADVIHPEDYARVLALNARYSVERPKSYEMQFRFIRKDGSVFWTLEKGTYIENFRGEPAYLSVFIDISQQKSSEQTLFERNAMFDVLLDNSNLSMWTYDIKTHTAALVSSKRHYRPILSTGTPNYPESVIATGLVDEKSIEDMRAMLRRVDSGIKTTSAEIWYAPDTEEPWCDRVSYVSIFDKEGNILRTIGIAEDITAQKLAQRKYEEELDYQKNMQDDSLLSSARCNITKRTMEAVYSCENRISIREDVPYEEGFRVMVATGYGESDRQVIAEKVNLSYLEKAFDRGTAQISFDYRRKALSGKVLWVNTTLKLYREAQTGDLKSFLYTTDVNKEKTNELIIQTVASAEHDLILLVDLKTDEFSLYAQNIDDVGPALSSGSNYTQGMELSCRQGIVAENLAQALWAMSPDGIRENLKKSRLFSSVFTTKSPSGGLEYKKLQYFWLDKALELVIVTRGDVTDLTKEQQRQQELLRSALQQAEHASNAKTDFLSKMSHEIRTPINAIIGMNTLAIQNLGNPTAVSDFLSKVGLSARYLLTLINDILDMSRIESGKLTLRREKIPFEEFLSGVNNIIYEQAAEKGISYDAIITGFVAETYMGDAMKLQQVLVNLLGNAVKFTPKGGKVQLIVSQERVENKTAYMKFTVNDTGCGISEKFQKVIFEPFEQEHGGTTTTYGGTGLGLAISKNIVTLMGGSISISSIVGVGSEFTVHVPLELVQDKGGSGPSSDVPFGKMSALIVDDELLICQQVHSTLLEIGMKAEWVTSGQQAVERVRQMRAGKKYYDIILVDLKMPDMDGIETARQIRRVVGPDVTIIIITAYEWAGIEAEAKAAGVNLLITKPLFKASLVSTFERLFSSKTTALAPPVQKEYDFTGRRVLLVEDHLLNVEVAKRLLEARGMAVEVAENGLVAIEAFAKTPVGYFDAILMDIRMPVMDGLTAAKSIRQMKKKTAQTIPIIAMSANAFDEDVEKSIQAGMNAHLSKPIEPQLLFEKLAEMFTQRA